MKNAIGYCRVSKQEQVDEGDSLGMQAEKIRAYCTLQGLVLVDLIVEEGISGSKLLHTRPEGKRLLAQIQNGRVQHVVTWKLDRLFRNAADALTQARILDQRGVALHLVDLGGQTINTASAVGKLFFGMLAGIAEFERNLISERTRAVLQYKKKQGQRYSAHVPFGWVQDGELLRPDPKEQAILRHIQTWRKDDRLSYGKIAQKLNEQQIPTKQGGQRWYASSVRCVCR